MALSKYFYNQYVEKVESDVQSTNQSAEEAEQTNQEQTEEEESQVAKQDSSVTTEEPPVVIRQELIHPNDVVKTLRQFVEDNREPFR